MPNSSLVEHKHTIATTLRMLNWIVPSSRTLDYEWKYLDLGRQEIAKKAIENASGKKWLKLLFIQSESGLSLAAHYERNDENFLECESVYIKPNVHAVELSLTVKSFIDRISGIIDDTFSRKLFLSSPDEYSHKNLPLFGEPGTTEIMDGFIDKLDSSQQLKLLVLDRLIENGWSALSSTSMFYTTGVAEKSFAYSDKNSSSAIVYIHSVKDSEAPDLRAVVTGGYWHGFNNLLSTTSFFIKDEMSEDDIFKGIDAFVRSAEDVIDNHRPRSLYLQAKRNQLVNQDESSFGIS